MHMTRYSAHTCIILIIYLTTYIYYFLINLIDTGPVSYLKNTPI